MSIKGFIVYRIVLYDMVEYDMNDPLTDRERAIAHLEKPTEGFLSVLDRLEGVDRSDDFKRLESEKYD